MKRGSPFLTWASVLILFLAYTSAFIDRQILSLLVGPIRADLHISDTQFSLLQGFAFTLFYALFGIPIGRLVDRLDRGATLAAGIALWSGFCGLGGLSRSFGQLFLLRMGVGVGEATVVPVTYSLLGDYFTPGGRGFALGVFGSGVYFGLGGALLLGGGLIGLLDGIGSVNVPILGILHPWQATLLAVGISGIVVALMALLLYEPRRGIKPAASAPGQREDRKTMCNSTWSYYRSIRAAIVLHHLCVAFMSMVIYSILTWTPEYFRRTFGIAPSLSGPRMGIMIFAAGTLGVIAGGALSDRAFRQGAPSARLIVLLAASALAIPATAVFAFGTSPDIALVGLGGVVLCVSTLTSVGAAGVQDLLPQDMRGLGAAIFQLVVNLVGLGIGPTVIAVMTDYVFGNEQSLSTSLGVGLPIMLMIAAVLAYCGLKPYAEAARSVLGLSENSSQNLRAARQVTESGICNSDVQ